MGTAPTLEERVDDARAPASKLTGIGDDRCAASKTRSRLKSSFLQARSSRYG